MPHMPCPTWFRVCLAVSLVSLFDVFWLSVMSVVGPVHMPMDVIRVSPLPLAEASIAAASVNLMW